MKQSLIVDSVSNRKGVLTENFVLQTLINQFETLPRYWISNGKAEVDFIIQQANNIIPIEVKSDINVTSRSLTLYSQKYKEETKIRIRFSLRNLTLDNSLINIPLFMADYTSKILTMVNI